METIGTDKLNDIIGTINSVVSTALGILTAGVTILAIFIAYKFFTADTDDKRKNAKAQLIYAIIGVVVLLALLIFVPTVIETVKNSIGGGTSAPAQGNQQSGDQNDGEHMFRLVLGMFGLGF